LHDDVHHGDHIVVDTEQGKMRFVASRQLGERPMLPNTSIS
jgi:hypothetical protein